MIGAMFRFLFRILLLAGLVWASFVLEYEGRPVSAWAGDWASAAWDRALPLGRELARDAWEARRRTSEATPDLEETTAPAPPPRARVEALAEARERVAPAPPGENRDFDRPQSAEERRKLDERLRRGLR